MIEANARALETGKLPLELAEAVQLRAGVRCVSEVKEGFVPAVIVQHARPARQTFVGATASANCKSLKPNAPLWMSIRPAARNSGMTSRRSKSRWWFK